MVALDTKNGNQVWRVDREERGNNWSTPLVWENRIRTEIVTAGSDGARSYDLDGNLLWELHGMSNLNSPSPFVSDGLVYISSGYPGGALRPVYAIHPGAVGDISIWADETSTWSARFPGNRASSEYIAWAYPLLGTYNTSALVYRGYYYTLLDRGLFLSHNARTGEEVYGRQRIRVGSGFSASPWGYNGKVFVLSEAGDTYVIQAGPEFNILGTNSLNEMTLATPAVVRGKCFYSNPVVALSDCEKVRAVTRRIFLAGMTLLLWSGLAEINTGRVSAQTMELAEVGVLPGPADLVETEWSACIRRG